MFLRQIQIRGFKSFADKTVLEFIPGVSVIVGPNGSGKSNLVDAISWALGEQGARALRGGHMADVIFAGTPSRPALGMAEVKLVIDNSAGKIAVPMSEIEVSRTIFRSGESEYRINGQVVRLLDVQELLSETGIGRALHTVVGQGQLEEVLLARPEERRKYIEEAAGIAKHRRRKERAERKLSGLDQDLLRLQDVLAELRRQLKPLQQQAEMAKKHETLTEQAEELSRKLAAARLRALMRERDRRKGGWDRGPGGAEGRPGAARQPRRAGAAGGRRSRRPRPARSPTPSRSFRAAQADRTEADQAFRPAWSGSRRRAGTCPPRPRGPRGWTASTASWPAPNRSSRGHRRARGGRARAGSSGAGVPGGGGASPRDRGRSAADGRGGGRASRRDGGAPPEPRRSSERERERVDEGLRDVADRIRTLEHEREGLEADIERVDGQTSPLADRRTQLEQERRGSVEGSRSSRTSSAAIRPGSTCWRLVAATSRRPPGRDSSLSHRTRDRPAP